MERKKYTVPKFNLKMSINAIKTFQDFIILDCDRISYFRIITIRIIFLFCSSDNSFLKVYNCVSSMIPSLC
jgi:hypothetical protein